ncbi:hypothetical protein Acy02nite_72130 [Actinoplanes cyaneus]|uniref:DUF6985 domain-containing protein n=1 Tax=Actinoplanes cyaneus TaxID=52696 RepID=A0A919IRX3_9ACTN|nr:hypothetical protein [Actinoplanes cyaneus]MCW2142313.1 hypothetical protein [Actinoplanes cyaneus]GID69332.1 hypothetical protein Acy02nite_72130 [Actinoplanes cyaneus]
MEIAGLGVVVLDDKLGCWLSEEIAIPVLDDTPCLVAIRGYDDDPAPEDFHAAIRNFLTLDRSVLLAAAPHIFAYYRDVTEDAGDDWRVEIDSPADVFDHLRFVELVTIERDQLDDRHVYVSVEGDCDWNDEDGLQLVFRDGLAVTKAGPFDGHLTNAGAYADESLRGVVYPAR